jgi:hypothetical protein
LPKAIPAYNTAARDLPGKSRICHQRFLLRKKRTGYHPPAAAIAIPGGGQSWRVRQNIAPCPQNWVAG